MFQDIAMRIEHAKIDRTSTDTSNYVHNANADAGE